MGSGHKDAGTSTHSVSGSNANYNVKLVDGSLTIAKADVTLEANSATYTYNGANQSVSGFNVISGALYGNDNTSFSAMTSRKDAGISTTSVLGSNTNYNVKLVDGSITIAKADVTLQANSATYIYNGTNQSVSGFNVISGALYGNDNTSFSAMVSRKDAGTSTHSVLGSNSNYNVKLVDGSITIAKADVTLQANSATYTYNGANQSVSGFNVISGALYGNDNTSFSAMTSRKDAGTSTHSVLGSNDNYNVKRVDGVLNITPTNLILTALAQSKIYDGSTNVNNISAFTVTGLMAGETISSVTLAFNNKNAGPGNKTISISHAVAGANTMLENYNIIYANDTTSTITPAVIAAVNNVSALNKIYDGTTKATLNTSGAIINGVYAGDQLNITGATGAFDSAAIGTHKTVNIGNITLGGTSVLNYQLGSTTAITYADIIQNTSLNSTVELTLAKAVISNSVSESIVAKSMIVKPEDYIFVGRTYDFKSVAYSLKFDYVNNRNNLVAFNGSGLNLK